MGALEFLILIDILLSCAEVEPQPQEHQEVAPGEPLTPPSPPRMSSPARDNAPPRASTPPRASSPTRVSTPPREGASGLPPAGATTTPPRESSPARDPVIEEARAGKPLHFLLLGFFFLDICLTNLSFLFLLLDPPAPESREMETLAEEEVRGDAGDATAAEGTDGADEPTAEETAPTADAAA